MSENENNTGPSSRGLEALKIHVMQHKIEVALWAIRVLTILFSIGYFIPIFSSSTNAYYKALVANAAISALRLHQRLGGAQIQISRELFVRVLSEDSCHYLFYSLIFLYVTPITLALFPVTLFAILHAASYSLTLLDLLGQNSWWGARLLISVVEFQSRNILRLVAFTEILLMPVCWILICMGRAGLLTPFIYYHFVVQRYSSRRNPYTRNMFHELRTLFESVAQKPAVPTILRKAIHTSIGFVSRLAPPQQAA